MEKGKMVFKTDPDRGFVFTAWYSKDDDDGDAIIEIERDGEIIRSFRFPAYKVFNIAAHASDIIESELSKNVEGYRKAGSDGLGGNVFT